MFLKIMHDGADEFLATAQSEATYSIYGDVSSCHFTRFKPPGERSEPREFIYGEAHIWCREPVKTAEVAGYAEIEKHIEITGDAFLMNDQGRTISKFVARPFGSAGEINRAISDGPEAFNKLLSGEPSDEERAIELLRNMPYSVAAMMRTVVRQGFSVSSDNLKKLLDKARVAVDA